ncbi:O-antigen ligase [Methylobacter sp. S3L5C]|uniref:O-antigen ligase family protein n=1 Tax=Methylobacter sp. S3L5C TaxID=2839024 RepID=UPI001FAD5742|nr:O-antigen ligase family protein [Methylobacter sp. S3L5C]UOA08552.1 hypothetical protein KKZ03_20565 [Methylobacter sp. S3L5C]
MINNFRFKKLTLLVFCLYLFWGFFGIDITINNGGDRLPLHRVFILLTLFIFAFNIKEIVYCLITNKLLVGLILYILMSAVWSTNPSDTIKGFVFLFSSLVISTMTALAFRDNQIKFVRGLFWLCFLMIIASIIAAIKFPQYGINVKDFATVRWIGITDHPNKLGALALSSIWLSINLFYLSTNKLEKIISITGIIAAIYAAFHADSMTGIIAGFIAIFYTLYEYVLGTKSPPVKIIFFTITLLAGLVITTFYMNSSEITDQTLASSGRDASLTGRTKLWENGFNALSNHLIIGSGFDNLDGLTKKYHMRMAHLHNGYIELLVKGGLIAGLLVFFILLNTFVKQRALKKHHSPNFVLLSTGFVSILIHNLAESSLFKGFNSLSLLFIFILVSTSVVYYELMNKKNHV